MQKNQTTANIIGNLNSGDASELTSHFNQPSGSVIGTYNTGSNNTIITNIFLPTPPSFDEQHTAPQIIDLADEIKHMYAQNNYIANHFHEPIPLDKGFIRLAIVSEEAQDQKTKDNLIEEQSDSNASSYTEQRLSCFEEIYGTKDPIDLKNLFTPDKQEKIFGIQLRRVMVLGRAGIGKSTMCQAIAYQWAVNDLWKDRFKILIWIPLRNLLEYSENEMTICDAILNEVIPVDHLGGKTLSKNQIQTALKQYKPSEILYLLDGYDELSGKSNRLIESLLTQENIILTSRPHGGNTYLASPNAKPMDRKLENIGFLDDDIYAYIQMFFSQMRDGKVYSESLHSFLKEHPSIWGIAHVPINLLLLCIAWMDNFEKLNMHHIQNIRLTDLYKGLLVNMGRRSLIKSGVDSAASFTPTEILLHEQCKRVIDALSFLAFEQMQNVSLLIPVEKLDLYGPLKSEILKFGCLTPTDRRGNAYYFLHLTLQDFFSALHIVEKLKSNDVEIKKFIVNHKYYPRYEMIWWFVSGLLSTKDNKKTLDLFFELLQSEPRDLNHLYHHLLMMRCLDECQLRVNPEVKDQFFQNHKKFISIFTSEKRTKLQFFEKSLSNYYKLCPSLISQSEFISIFEDLYNGPQRAIAMSLLQHQTHLPKPLYNLMMQCLESQNEKTIALEFLQEQSLISPDILEKFPSLLRDPSTEVKKKTIKCIQKLQHIDISLAESFILLFSEDRLFEPNDLIWFYERISKQTELWQLILPLFQHPNANVKIRAIFCMKKLPPQAYHVTILLPLLKDPDWQVRRFATRVIVLQPGFQFEMLEPLLDDPHEKVFKEAKEGIFALFKKPVSFQSVEKLLSYANTKFKSIILSCLWSSAQLSNKELSYVIPSLCDADDSVRGHASSCIRSVKILSQEIIEEIKPLLCHNEAKIRFTAVSCFRDVTLIIPLLTDPEANVKKAVLQSLSMSGLQTILQTHLKPLFNDADPDVRCAAIDCLCKQSEFSIELLLSAARDDHPKVRKKALEQMGRYKQLFQQYIKAKDDLLSDPDKSIRELTMLLIVRHIGSNTFDLAISALKKPDGEVRRHAMNFINQHYPDCQEVMLYLDSLLEDPNSGVRAAALDYLNNQSELSAENIEKFIRTLVTTKIYLYSSRKLIINPVLSKYHVPYLNVSNALASSYLRNHFISSVLPKETQLLLVPYLSTFHFCSINTIPILVKHLLSFEVYQKFGEVYLSKHKIWDLNITQVLDKKSISSLVTVFAQHKNQLTIEILRLLAYKALKLNIPIFSCSSTCIQIGEFDKIVFENEKDLNEFIMNYQEAFTDVCGLIFEPPVQNLSPSLRQFGVFPPPLPNPVPQILMHEEWSEVQSKNDADEELCVVM